MTRNRMDITSKPWQHRIRAALTAALLPVLAVMFILGAISPAEAAKNRKTDTRIVEPTSVTVASTTCTANDDGSWDVTTTFAVSGGRYLNLGDAEDTATALNGGRYDNVRGGGTRHLTSTLHFSGYPGFEDDPSAVLTAIFTYQQQIAPVTAQSKPVNHRTMRLLSRDFTVNYTCAKS